MSSYRQILKSTALIGGTQVINIAIGVVRTKFLAVLLGPAGVGAVGLYQSTMGLISTVAGLGIGRAAVRQIAEADSSGNEDKIALTVKSVRQLSLVSGLLGMLLVLLLCKPIAWLTFGDYSHVWGVAIVSMIILFDSISAGQTALLQGMRKLKELAGCQVLGTILGSFASILIVYFYGVQAIAWYLVTISALGVLTSWWYARRVRIKPSLAAMRNVIVEAGTLLRVGAAFLVSGLVSAGTMYLARVLVTRELGIDAVGLYTAVITLSSLYVNMVLQAMVSDYYPRLTAVANDHSQVNRMVNEQTEMGLLLAIPGIIATITLAPWILGLFYSEAFSPAADVIRWQLLGVAFRVLSWPIAIIMPAKGLSRLMIMAEMLAGVVQVASLLLCIKLWGLDGTGISFLITYVAYTLAVYAIARKKTGFSWTGKARLIIGASCAVMTAVFLAIFFLPRFPGTIAGLAITAATTIVCIVYIKDMISTRKASA